ncbi:hypothetical protein JMJ35_009608 [Cladonia borealis]|uniref:F-box domain-containing protein n=1 Tax=Cladonia borealis TaxID=184061 RepID=A0AA39V1S1_9LECA|nr:hypothetical protein JMJ35_009608 [Cladonia borealis]
MPFPILLLPGELRNLILRHLLTHRTPIHTTSANNLFPPHPTPLHLTPSILSTCHQLHAESLSILYAENTFQAHPTYLTSILFAIDPSRPITSPLHISLLNPILHDGNLRFSGVLAHCCGARQSFGR